MIIENDDGSETVIRGGKTIVRPATEEKEFRVTWEIELSAENALDAARKALAIHRDPESLATIFTVFALEGRRKPGVTLDLSFIDGDGIE